MQIINKGYLEREATLVKVCLLKTKYIVQSQQEEVGGEGCGPRDY